LKVKLKLILILFIFLNNGDLFPQEKLNDFRPEFPKSLNDRAESGFSFYTAKTLALLFPLNPIFLIENKKFYVGITKEISLGKFPYGRLAAEYSLIFRETHLNQLRFSYNFDIPLETSDFAVFMLSLGGGYFTDFSKEGYFPQASLNLIIPFDNVIGMSTYLKFRNTFITEENESDIFDFSLGIAAAIYL